MPPLQNRTGLPAQSKAAMTALRGPSDTARPTSELDCHLRRSSLAKATITTTHCHGGAMLHLPPLPYGAADPGLAVAAATHRRRDITPTAGSAVAVAGTRYCQLHARLRRFSLREKRDRAGCRHHVWAADTNP